MASTSTDTALENDNDGNQGPKRKGSKKNKFRPFSAVRRLFSGGKSKRKASITTDDGENHAAKGRPLSAPVSIHGDSSGQERLGVQRQASMGDDHIISDDNIISPEQKDTVILRAQKSAVLADPNLPKAAFKAELTSRLSKRRSLTSEEDEEDGLRQGQAPPATTTDIKEDLFHSQWTTAVLGAQSPSSDIGTETQGSLDLSEMTRTELLKSDAAKDRISVKPRTRKTNWQSRKRREGRYSLSLPSLVEVESGSGSIISGGGGPAPHPGGRPQSEYIDPSILSDFDLQMIPSALSAVELTDVGRRGSELGTAAAPPTIVTTTMTVQSNTQDLRHTKSKPDSPPTNGKTHRVSFATDTAGPERSVPAAETVTQTVVASSPVIQTPREEEETKVNTTVVASPVVVIADRDVKTSTILHTPSASSVSTSADRKREGLRQADSQSEDAFSPKPDYKIRRQQRSKTLPVHQSTVTVQRTASQRGDTSSSNVTKYQGEKEKQGQSEEPEWVALARRKSQKHNEQSASSASAAVRQLPESGPHVIINTATTSDVTNTSGNVTIPSHTVPTPTPNTIIVSSATTTQENHGQAGVGWSGRGGSVKIPQSSTTLLTTNRGGSVKVTTLRSQPSSSSSTPSLPGNIPASSTSSSSSATSVMAEPRTPQSVFVSDVRKTQSTKTPSTYLSSASSTMSSPALTSPSGPSSPPPSSRPVSASTPKTDTRSMSSVQTGSLQRPVSQKSSTPAWRSELVQRSLDVTDVKIELIEKAPSGVDSRVSSKNTMAGSSSRQDSVTKAGGDLPVDQCRSSVPTRRHSRVMDLLKNFESMQSVS